jgi:hypothetical protein
MTEETPATAKSDVQVEFAKLQLERDKFEYEKGRSGRLSTSQLALLASLLSVLSGLLGAAITGWFSKQSEEVKLKAGVGIEEVKGGSSINLEKLKFETGLIIQAIKTDDQAKAVKTLKFLANAGLIPTFEKRVLALAEADNGIGVPALEGPKSTPGEIYSNTTHGTLLASFVGYLEYEGFGFCNATFIDAKHFVTPAHCIADQKVDKLKMVAADVEIQNRGVDPAVNYRAIYLNIQSIQKNDEKSIVLGTLANPHPNLKSPLKIRAPKVGEPIRVVYFSLMGTDRMLRVVSDSQCAVRAIDSSGLRGDQFAYTCSTPPGSSGAAIVSRFDSSIVGMPESASPYGDVGVRINTETIGKMVVQPRL